MKLLLDTHTLLWWRDNPAELSAVSLTALRDSSNTLFLSMVSLWELQIKVGLNKLSVSVSISEMVRQEVEVNGMQLLPIALDHIYALSSLPHHHRDPFDRLLIAQAQVEGATLVTKDHLIALYSIPTLW